MADTVQQAQAALPPTGEFPPPQFPVVFADGVLNVANSPSVVKFYLYRFEASYASDGRSQTQPFAEVVMPMDGFAGAVTLFEAALRRFIIQGFITQARVDELRKAYLAPS